MFGKNCSSLISRGVHTHACENIQKQLSVCHPQKGSKTYPWIKAPWITSLSSSHHNPAPLVWPPYKCLLNELFAHLEFLPGSQPLLGNITWYLAEWDPKTIPYSIYRSYSSFSHWLIAPPLSDFLLKGPAIFRELRSWGAWIQVETNRGLALGNMC